MITIKIKEIEMGNQKLQCPSEEMYTIFTEHDILNDDLYQAHDSVFRRVMKNTAHKQRRPNASFAVFQCLPCPTNYYRCCKFLLGFLDWQCLRQRKQSKDYSNCKVFHRCKRLINFFQCFRCEFVMAPKNLFLNDKDGAVFICYQELS